MFKNLSARFALIIALMGLSAWFLYDRGIVLGLDLQGGTHLALEVEDPDRTMSAAAREDAIDRALTVIRTRIDELGVAEPTVQKVGADRIVVELPGIRDEGQARDVIQRTAFLQFQIVRPVSELEGVLRRMDRAVVDALGDEALEPEPEDELEPRIDLFEPAAEAPEGEPDEEEPLPEDEDTGAEAAPAAPTDDEARPLSGRLFPSGGESMVVGEEDVELVDRYISLPEVQRLLPRNSVLVWGQRPRGEDARAFRDLYLLEAEPIMTGDRLEDAQAQRDPQFNQPIVTFQLTRAGGRAFERATGRHINEQMAIVLDNQVITAPTIRSQIGSRGQIEMGTAGMDETRTLALILRAGALPVPLEIVEERSVGPTLGQDSIDRGQLAGIIGLIFVVIIIMAYYRIAGVMAVAALSIYLLFVMGGLSIINATLTLPGIAGLILSIGMAVDANVLIFERIREEIDAGRSSRVSVNEGFKHALSAIVDANLTTLITAAILFYFGTGPVRGFAVTLGIGIIASMFTAIFITRTFFMVYLNRQKAGQPVSI